MPRFAPVRVRGGRYRLGRLVRSRRRALALGLAITAAALVASGPRDGDAAHGPPGGTARPDTRGSSHPRAHVPLRAPAHGPRAGKKVAAPVRIADAATVRLLRPGDRVDVIAAEPATLGGMDGAGGDARVVARGALVTKVPEPLDTAAGTADDGALVVLSVPRSTAARLAGASATARLAVTLW
ncbi:RcpC/CpaB family pilus assembly protein [Streptomyces sp. NPDC005329]|uniref:RcpC/CpaB family pilus assembly protein n=1 Tax=Streptomyces sp. NPDC005329 TaxID=3157034 RepID=UPI0033A15144